MFPPSRMAESSEAISAFAPSFCRRFVWSPWRSRRHDVIPPPETGLLLTVASVETFPVGLCMIVFMNVHLVKIKVFLRVCFPGQIKPDFLIRESKIPFKCWFISLQHHFLHLRVFCCIRGYGQDEQILSDPRKQICTQILMLASSIRAQ